MLVSDFQANVCTFILLFYPLRCFLFTGARCLLTCNLPFSFHIRYIFQHTVNLLKLIFSMVEVAMNQWGPFRFGGLAKFLKVLQKGAFNSTTLHSL